MNVDAEAVYWTYIRLNGTAVPGKPGEYQASHYAWTNAAKMKSDKLEECKLLYGPR